MSDTLEQIIDHAIQKRTSLIRSPYTTAFRLINGFLEQLPQMSVDVFAQTVVIHDYTNDDVLVKKVIAILEEKLSWVKTVIVKKRRSKKEKEQCGIIYLGESPDTQIEENGVLYAIDLCLNQDASFYLDTKHLRVWLKDNMLGKSVLNTFAYTGSLGVAALAGGATDLVQLDLNRAFLALARKSSQLNNFPIKNSQFQVADFWSRIHHFKTINATFDCVILDPPVYSKTSKGSIDSSNYHKLINKVRPIINDGGTLITVNNALFQSGEDHMKRLEALCTTPYLSIDSMVSVPEECIGDSDAIKDGLPTDPSPYNHSTKITILNITKKK